MAGVLVTHRPWTARQRTISATRAAEPPNAPACAHSPAPAAALGVYAPYAAVETTGSTPHSSAAEADTSGASPRTPSCHEPGRGHVGL